MSKKQANTNGRSKSKIIFGQVRQAREGLKSVGAAKMPIPLAVRMAEAQQALESQEDKIDKVRAGFIRDLTDGKDKIDDKHPNWGAFVEAFDELMKREYTLPDRFTLYARPSQDGDEFEYSWTEGFKSVLEQGIEPNVVKALLPVMDIVEVERK